jgi:hypothetical protein
MTDTTGQIGLVRTKGFFAWLYCTVTGSPTSHVVVGVSPTHNVGAEPGGVRVRPNSDYDRIVWSNYDLSLRQKYRIVRYVNDKKTMPYSYLTVLALALEVATGIPTPEWLERYLSSEYVFECAQLAYAAYLSAGVEELLVEDSDRLPGRVRPDSYVPTFKKRGWIGAWW